MEGVPRENRKKPKFTVNLNDEIFVAIRLAKVWGCRPDEVLDTRCDLVVAALQYEVFCNDFEAAYIALNTKEP